MSAIIQKNGSFFEAHALKCIMTQLNGSINKFNEVNVLSSSSDAPSPLFPHKWTRILWRWQFSFDRPFRWRHSEVVKRRSATPRTMIVLCTYSCMQVQAYTSTRRAPTWKKTFLPGQKRGKICQSFSSHKWYKLISPVPFSLFAHATAVNHSAEFAPFYRNPILIIIIVHVDIANRRCQTGQRQIVVPCLLPDHLRMSRFASSLSLISSSLPPPPVHISTINCTRMNL